MSRKAETHIRSMWSKAGLGEIPTPNETIGNMTLPEAPVRRSRKKSARTARLDLRLSPSEKKRIELMAVSEGVSINELFSRMLALYEREHGRIEVMSTRAEHGKRGA